MSLIRSIFTDIRSVKLPSVSRIKIPLLLVAIFWLVEIFELMIQSDFHALGVFPRSIYGVAGIFFMPFLHGDLRHLISNTPPFLILCGSLFYFYPKIAHQVLLQTFLLTGLGIWLFGRSEEVTELGKAQVYHIGASGLIYAFAGFLFFNGAFRKDRKSLAISLSVAVLYFGMWQGLIPNQPGVSWESHLIGALVGTVLAYFFKSVNVTDVPAPEELSAVPPPLPATEGFQPLENERIKYYYVEKTNSNPLNEPYER